jgi:hypothetical protein
MEIHSSKTDITTSSGKWQDNPGGRWIESAKMRKNMPAVKKLHQESGLNSKPDYFFGHSCQVIAVLLGRMKSIFAVHLSM